MASQGSVAELLLLAMPQTHGPHPCCFGCPFCEVLGALVCTLLAGMLLAGMVFVSMVFRTALVALQRLSPKLGQLPEA